MKTEGSMGKDPLKRPAWLKALHFPRGPGISRLLGRERAEQTEAGPSAQIQPSAPVETRSSRGSPPPRQASPTRSTPGSPQFVDPDQQVREAFVGSRGVGMRPPNTLPVKFNHNSPVEVRKLLDELKLAQAGGKMIAAISGGSLSGMSIGMMLDSLKEETGDEWVALVNEARAVYSRENVLSSRLDAPAFIADTSEPLLQALLDKRQISPVVKNVIVEPHPVGSAKWPDDERTVESSDPSQVVALAKDWQYRDLETISPHIPVMAQAPNLESGLNDYCVRQDNIHFIHSEMVVSRVEDGVYAPVFHMKDDDGNPVTVELPFVADLVVLADGTSSKNAERTHPLTRIPTKELMYLTNFESARSDEFDGFFMLKNSRQQEFKVGLHINGPDRNVTTVALNMSQAHENAINRAEGRPEGQSLSPKALQEKLDDAKPLLEQGGYPGSVNLEDAAYHSGRLEFAQTVATTPIDGNKIHVGGAAVGGTATGGFGASLALSKFPQLVRRHVTDPRFKSMDNSKDKQARLGLEQRYREGVAQIARIHHESLGDSMRELGFYDEQYDAQYAQAMQQLLRTKPEEDSGAAQDE
jgi:2-polyprenyl-6-methoxyphenol hydroxylase-like FAD-dependent oxidoreductase